MLNRLLNSPAFAGTVAGLVVALMLAAFLLVKIAGEIITWNDEGAFPTNTITVNGSGEALAIPDTATFSFTVMETADTTEAAQNLATEKSNKAVDFLKQNGVEDRDIKTSGYNTYPKYDYGRICTAFDCPESSAPRIIGYEVSQSFDIKVRQQEEAGKFLTELGKIGVSNISSLSFVIDDTDALYDDAREDAINKAKEKAEKLAKQLGVRLDDIVSFGEDQPNNFGYGGVAEMKTLSADSVAPVLPQGENTYTSNVWITYSIK